MIKEGSKVIIKSQGKQAKVLLVNKEYQNAIIYGKDFRYIVDLKELEEIE